MQSPQPCRELLAGYIEALRRKDLPWYERSSSRQYWLWHTLSIGAFVTTVATSAIAALMKQEYLAAHAQVLLVILPLIGAASSAVLSQFRFRELEDLRERGRIEMEDILLSAEGLLAAAADDDACKRAYDETRKRVKVLDLSQHRGHTELKAGSVQPELQHARRTGSPEA